MQFVFNMEDWREACPKCDGDVIEYKRICFGTDPHIEYTCTKCPWKGRDPVLAPIPPAIVGYYGDAPVEIEEVDFSGVWEEFMTYQYLPVRLPEREGWKNTTLAFPDRLEFLYDLVAMAWSDAVATYPHLQDPYVYVTAKRGWASRENPLNRKGWHCDGFGTDDINYVWCDEFPTVWAPFEFSDISDDHLVSLAQFEEQCRWRGAPSPIKTNVLYRLTPFVVHAAPMDCSGGMRSFLKVSVSNHRYNLVGNSHNYCLDYDWEMFPRDMLRNDPHRAGLDFVEE